MSWYGDDPNNPAPASRTNVSVNLDAHADGQGFESFGTIFSTRFEVEAAPDALTGVIHFTGLAAEPQGPNPTPSPDSISGAVSWDCR